MGTSGKHPEIYSPEESFLILYPILHVASLGWLAQTEQG